MNFTEFIKENFADRLNVTTLYHYCRTGVLECLIEPDAVLYCTRMDQLNDQYENRMAIRCLSDYFEQKCGWDDVKCNRLKIFFERMLNSAQPFMPGVMCFSRQRNNTALWRRNDYIDAYDGGYCVGFKLKQLVRFVIEFSSANLGIANAMVVPVFYTGIDNDDIVKIFDFYISPCIRDFEKMAGQAEADWRNHLSVVGKLLLLSVMIKDGESEKRWDLEKESRIVITPISNDKTICRTMSIGGKDRYPLINYHCGKPIKKVVELVRGIDVYSYCDGRNAELRDQATQMFGKFYPKKDLKISVLPV